MKSVIVKFVAAAFMVSLLAGCQTTGLSFREKGVTTYSRYVLSLPANTNAPAPLKLPARLAVAQVGEAAPTDQVLQELLRHPEIFSSAFGLPLPAEDEPRYGWREHAPPIDYAAHLRAIQLMARNEGADYIFLFGGNLDSWRKNNVLSIFDLTIVGGVILPGTKISLEGKAAGILLETTHLQPVSILNVETNASSYSPDLLVDGKEAEMRVEMRDKLMADLTTKLMHTVSQPH